MKILSLFLCLVFFACPLEPNQKVLRFDTGWFEIGEYQDVYGILSNEYRVIVSDRAWVYQERPIWVDSIKITFYWKEPHPKQKMNLWFAAPVQQSIIGKDREKFIETMKLGWDASVLSFGIFSENLYGTVRMNAKLYVSNH